ncbi:MAG: protease complex subunit PrcB family protein [Actinobacteria bacterium]|nr:protease complex subunit PrcB family protein [Actinomycetota bacterium]
MHLETRPPQKTTLLLSIICICIALVSIATPGCGGEAAPDGDESAGIEIPLQTLAQDVTSEYGRIDEIPVPEDTPPECVAISDEEEFQRLVSLSYFQEPIGYVDFDKYIVIAAMQGPKSTGGYAISIMHAFQSGSEVRVEVELVEPEPGSMTVQVLTSPYHLVLAERSAFDPRGELVFTFVDQEDNRISQQPTEV